MGFCTTAVTVGLVKNLKVRIPFGWQSGECKAGLLLSKWIISWMRTMSCWRLSVKPHVLYHAPPRPPPLPTVPLCKVNLALTTIFGNTGSDPSVHCPTCRVAMIVHYAVLEEARTVMSLPWEGSVFEFWVPCHRLPAVSKFKRWMSRSHLLMDQMR